jgi:hypothetical protein
MINFPIDTEIGQNYTDPSTDITWVWTGETWDFECELPPSSSYIGVSPIDVTTFTDEIGNKIITVSHEESGVVPGTYNSFTVDEFGHIIDTSTETVGHIIQNSGSDMPQRRYLDFRRMIVTDNQLFNQTVVTRPPSVSVGVDPPTEDLLEGDEWIDSLNWKKYIRYDDYWVETGKVEPSSSSGNPEAIERENNTVLFDRDYVIGNAGARSGNILFDFTGARLMSVTRMIHNHTTIPTFPAQSIIISGQYQLSVNNYIYFICTKKSSTEIVEVTIS